MAISAIQQIMNLDAQGMKELTSTYPQLNFRYIDRLVEVGHTKGLFKANADLIRLFNSLSKEAQLDHKLSFVYLPKAVESGLVKSVADIEKLLELKTKRNEVILALSEACTKGYFKRELLYVTLESIASGSMNYRIFEEMGAFKRHPIIKRYRALLQKKRLREEDFAAIYSTFRKFEKLSASAKQYTWNQHPNVGRVAFLEAERLLEPNNPEWKHKDVFQKPRYFRSIRESLQPVEFGVNVVKENPSIRITEAQEIDWLKKQFLTASMNKSLNPSKIINILNRLGMQPPKRVGALLALKKLNHVELIQRLTVEYLKAYPQKARKILITCMPAIQTTTLSPQMDLSGIERLHQLFQESIPRFLSENRLQIPNPFNAEAQRLDRLIRKYTFAKSQGVKTAFRLSPGKTFLDAQPGATGENCYIMKESIKNPHYHIVQIINTHTGTNEGTIHIYERTVNGEKAFVLAGVEPKQRLVRDTKESELYRALINGVERMAQRHGINHVYSTMDQHDISNRAEIAGRIKANPIVSLKNRIRMHGVQHRKVFHLTSHRR